MIGIFITTSHPLMHQVLCSFLVKHQITQVTQPLYSTYSVSCNFWLFPKLKSTLKGKRFQTIDEIQETTTEQQMTVPTKILQSILNSERDTGRTVWGPKVPTLKVSEASLSYIQCFLYLVCSLINVSIFSYDMAGYLLDRSHMLFKLCIILKI